MYLHEVVNNCKHAHDLCLHLKVVLLGNYQHLEVLLHYTKDPLNYVPELCMPIIKELFVILGPDGGR
jgi:hypothetical protein